VDNGRLSGRHREQAHSYSWTGYNHKNQVGCQAAFASKLSPTEKQSSAAARGEAAPLNNERKLEYRF
jgi:hypothetical protein